MRIATWNINSVRLRIGTVVEFLKKEKPHILCLQETKTPDEFFPLEDLKGAGYPHIVFRGMKGYNGVAIVSKYPLENFSVHERCGKSDCRHVSVAFAMPGIDAPVALHNVYIPAGGYEPDPVGNPSFRHKLDFVDELAGWFPQNAKKKQPVIMLGDLNIAPLENDVWSSRQMQNVVSHTPVEREKFARLYSSMNFYDAVRHFVPEEEKLYSWWSYRAADWEKSDRGRRLDHIWVTQPLVSALKGARILKEIRGAERPSDHVPVIVDFKKP